MKEDPGILSHFFQYCGPSVITGGQHSSTIWRQKLMNLQNYACSEIINHWRCLCITYPCTWEGYIWHGNLGGVQVRETERERETRRCKPVAHQLQLRFTECLLWAKHQAKDFACIITCSLQWSSTIIILLLKIETQKWLAQSCTAR